MQASKVKKSVFINMANIEKSEQVENEAKNNEVEFQDNVEDANINIDKESKTVIDQTGASFVNDLQTESNNSDCSQLVNPTSENNQNNIDLEPNRIYKNSHKQTETEDKRKIIKLQNIAAGCTIFSFLILEIPLSLIGLIVAFISLNKIKNLNLNETEVAALKRRSYFTLIAACVSLIMGIIIIASFGSEFVNLYDSYSNISAGQTTDSSVSSVWG